MKRMSISLASAALAATLTLVTQSAHAHSELSEVSALSALPVAVSVAAPVAILSGGFSRYNLKEIQSIGEALLYNEPIVR